MPGRNAHYGWRPDRPDIRDRMFRVEAPIALPAKVDLRSEMPPAYDQGELGSCTANAIAGAIEHLRRKEGKRDWLPSRLFIYYEERVIEGTVREDSGAEIRDGIKVCAGQGAPHENHWPYFIERFAEKPPAEVYDEADNHLISLYERIDNSRLDDIKAALARGHTVVFGFSVYQSFESAEVARTGIVPMPGKSEEMLGGHAVLMVGYDDAAGRAIVRNSWGSRWGEAGYFEMPYEYLTSPDLAADFWTVGLTG